MAFDFEKFGTPVKDEKSPAKKTGKFSFEDFGDVSQETEQKKKGAFGKVVDFGKEIVRPAVTLAVRPIQVAKALGGASEEEQAVNVPGFGKIETSRNASDVVKDIGRGVETVALGMGGSGVAGAGKQAVKETVKQAVKRGAIEGAKAGGAFGFGSTLEEKGTDVSAGDIVKGTAGGAAVGGAVGAAVPAVVGGVKSAFKKVAEKSAEKAEKIALIENKVPDSRVATEKVVGGKLVKDKVASEAVRQGIPEADVALIKTGSNSDKTKMIKMLETRQSQLTNKRVTDRATDVVGDTFVEKIAKPLAKTNKEAAKKLDIVAQKLAGKRVDPTSAVSSFADDLERSGIKVGKNGKLNFKNSDFEGIPSVQNAINNVWNRALRIAKSGDALQLHRAKRYVDEIVSYGKSAEGLSGKAETILKNFRRNADGILDTKFKAYNDANTVFSETIQELSKISEAMGKKFKIGEEFADARAGTTLRRILSNTQGRADLLQLLETSQAVAKKYGAKIDEDVITQANFADVLERMLGSEAPTSFLGQIEKGVGNIEKAVSAGGEFAQGNVVRGTIKAGAHMIDVLRGVSQENKIKALKALLENELGSAGAKAAKGVGPKLTNPTGAFKKPKIKIPKK